VHVGCPPSGESSFTAHSHLPFCTTTTFSLTRVTCEDQDAGRSTRGRDVKVRIRSAEIFKGKRQNQRRAGVCAHRNRIDIFCHRDATVMCSRSSRSLPVLIVEQRATDPWKKPPFLSGAAWDNLNVIGQHGNKDNLTE
jgi:hypothetical protein